MGQDVLQAIEQSSLARADGADGNLQPFAARHSLHHGAERIAMWLGKVQKARIGR
jgi:hypothetical protein